jgi:hypothetical protein
MGKESSGEMVARQLVACQLQNRGIEARRKDIKQGPGEKAKKDATA